MTWHGTHHPTHYYSVCSESFSNNQVVVLENFAEKQACSHSALILLSAGRPSPRAAWRTQTEIGHASFKRRMPHKPPLSSAPSSSSSKLPALLFLKLFIPRGLMPYEAFSPCEGLCQAADASCTNSDRPSSPLKDRPCVFIRNSERNMLYPVVRFALSCAQVGLCLWLGFLWLGCLFLQDWAAPLQKLVTCLAAKVANFGFFSHQLVNWANQLSINVDDVGAIRANTVAKNVWTSELSNSDSRGCKCLSRLEKLLSKQQVGLLSRSRAHSLRFASSTSFKASGHKRQGYCCQGKTNFRASCQPLRNWTKLPNQKGQKRFRIFQNSQ